MLMRIWGNTLNYRIFHFLGKRLDIENRPQDFIEHYSVLVLNSVLN